MSWNHCDDLGEDKSIYNMKLNQAKQYIIKMANISIFHKNEFYTVSYLYNKGIYENDYDYFDTIITHFV